MEEKEKKLNVIVRQWEGLSQPSTSIQSDCYHLDNMEHLDANTQMSAYFSVFNDKLACLFFLYKRGGCTQSLKLYHIFLYSFWKRQ